MCKNLLFYLQYDKIKKTKDKIMAYNYKPSDSSGKEKMNLSTWSMQVTSSINNIISLFASTFLVSFIVQTNQNAPLGQSLVSIALFYISQYAVVAFVYFIMGYLVDKSNRVWYYRLGILIKGLFIVLIIFLGEDLAKMAALAGVVYGIAESCYWSSYNVMKCEIIPRMQADNFVAINTLLNKFINIVFPILIGLLIDISTFMSVAIYVLILVAIQMVFSFFIKSQRPENSSFEFFKYLKNLRGDADGVKRIKRFYPIALCYGATTICTSISSLLAIYTFKTNLNLGLFTAIFSVLSVMALILFKKYTKIGLRKILYVILGVVPLIGALCVTINVEKWSYIAFYVSETVSLTVLAYALDVQRTIILKKTGHYSDIADHQTLTEVLFSFSRCVTFSIMLVLGLTLDVLGLRILMIIVGLVFPLLAFFLHRMEKVEMNYPLKSKEICACLENSNN